MFVRTASGASVKARSASDIVGHKRMVVIGVVVFTCSSALCGLTPTGSFAGPWLIGFRIVEGAGAALMYPAALALVVKAFPLDKRGSAMAGLMALAAVAAFVGLQKGRQTELVEALPGEPNTAAAPSS